MKKIWVCAIALLLVVLGTQQLQKHRMITEVIPEVYEPLPSKANPMIGEARKLLATQSAGYRLDEAGKKVVKHNVLLAVQGKDGDIETVKLKNGTRPEKGFRVAYPRLNGVNTQYEVTHPSGYTVLALKRVVRTDGFREVIYTPYTKSIDTPELRKEGLNYLKEKLDEAERNLDRKKIKSLAYGGKVTSVIPKDVALTLAIIEHIDPGRFNAGTPIHQLVGEVLVVLATNRENAYRYSVSKAGARGQFQFMRKTYEAIDRRYPKAGLIDDFILGMDNHVNAATASLLLFDSDLSYLRKDHRKFLKGHPEAMGKYLAAAYNGGPSKALKAIRRHGEAWEDHVLPETRTYLKEFEAVWKLLHT